MSFCCSFIEQSIYYIQGEFVVKKWITVAVIAAVVILEGAFWLFTSNTGKPVDAEGSRIDTSVESLLPAFTAYGWFSGKPLVHDKVPYEGNYYLVTDKTYQSMPKFTNYIRSVFNTPIADRLLGSNIYREIDGRLCVNPSAVVEAQMDMGNQISKEVFAITTETSRRIEYTATVTYVSAVNKNQVNDVVEYRFVCEDVGGKWLFTTFEYYQ